MLLVDLRAGFTMLVDSNVDFYFFRTRWLSRAARSKDDSEGADLYISAAIERQLAFPALHNDCAAR